MDVMSEPWAHPRSAQRKLRGEAESWSWPPGGSKPPGQRSASSNSEGSCSAELEEALQLAPCKSFGAQTLFPYLQDSSWHVEGLSDCPEQTGAVHAAQRATGTGDG